MRGIGGQHVGNAEDLHFRPGGERQPVCQATREHGVLRSGVDQEIERPLAFDMDRHRHATFAIGARLNRLGVAVRFGHFAHGDLDRRFEESYQGEYSSLEAYGEQTLDEMGLSIDDIPEIPESLRPYVRIDAEAWVRDLVYGGDIFTISSRTGIYVFWNY